MKIVSVKLRKFFEKNFSQTKKSEKKLDLVLLGVTLGLQHRYNMAFNSRIKQPVGQCIDCTDGEKKPLWAKRCWYHYQRVHSKVSNTNNTKLVKSANGEKEPATPTRTPLVLWYEEKMQNSVRCCENCGKPLYDLSQVDWHGSQAHLLPKSLFPSVATHPDNHAVLGRWCCHGRYDSNWMTASRMSVWPEAVRRLRRVIPLLAEKEQGRIPPELAFLVYWEVKPIVKDL